MKKRYPEAERLYKQRPENRARARALQAQRRAAIASTDEGKTKLREENRRAQLKHKYGLTVEQRDELLARQGNKCGVAGCTRPITFGGKAGAVVDHCHETGRVRGILCSPCNKAIGTLGDTEAALQNAVNYLRVA